MTYERPEMPWTLAPVDDDVVAELGAKLGTSTITARLLAARGLGEEDAARRFLDPSLDRDWRDPGEIPGMQYAAERVATAIRASERILVFGDFDLDGISAAAVATRGLRALGGDVDVIVPHRTREGYGLTAPAIERAMNFSPDVVVTVDCGISGAQEVDALRALGVDVVVTDHHEPGAGVPVGVPVANPKLHADSPSRELAGAGVALKLVHAVGLVLGQADVWRELVDLATLGTIADVVPLVGENRALVASGVRDVARSPRTAIAALCAAAGVSPATFTADSVAFALAPRLNAAGRMADPQIALDLLLTDDPVRAEELARTLDDLNRERQAVEADLYAAAMTVLERTYRGERGIVLSGDGWHEGVKGIVASRIAAVYNVPTVLFSVHDGIARGSGRSAGSVDLFSAVQGCGPVLERFGGHEAAVGLTIAERDLEMFRGLLLEQLDALPVESFDTAIEVDAEVALDELSAELGEELGRLEPFGHGNRRPLLAARSVFMTGRERVGRNAGHLRFRAFDGATTVPAIAFRCRDIESLAAEETAVDLAFELQIDEWRGRRRTQIIVRHIAIPHASHGEGEGATELVDRLFAAADELIAREEYAGIEDAPSFHTKLAGVTFEGRQDLLERLVPGAPLRLVRQPGNEHDANACALFDSYGNQVGYLNRRLAGVLAPAIDAGVEYDVEVTDLTGGEEGRSRGVNVLLTRRDAAAEVEAAALDLHRRRTELQALAADSLERELVSRFLGERSLHSAQVKALAALERGVSTLAVMATGRGKSLIFHLHAARLALRRGLASVFVYPLRALVADQAFHLTDALGELGLCVRVVTGETSQADRDTAFRALADGGLDVVLTTPEFLHFHADRFAHAGRVGFVVVDEAHHVGMARAGHRPAYARLGDALVALGHPTVLAVTATASDDVVAELHAALSIDELVLDPTVRENLAVVDRRGSNDKDAYLTGLVAQGGKAVVYVNSRDASVRIARMMRKRIPDLAYRTAFYNGGLSRSVRHAVEAAFRTGDVRVVIATSAFGEGVNIPDIRDVVLYHLPFNDVEFNQMAGRAGRDGALARVHLLFGENDARINTTILSSLAPSRDDLAALYRVLRETESRDGSGFEVTNAELADACRRIRRSCTLDERGVSSAIAVFRDLGLVTSEGHGAYRRLTLVADAHKVDLAQSVRYAEGLDEIADFELFKRWVLESGDDELLARFNRPILPTRDWQATIGHK